MTLRRVLVVYSSRPPIIDYLTRAFRERGVEAEGLYADSNTWFDRCVIRHVNKIAHNLRVLPKDKSFFSGHPMAHRNYRGSALLEKVEEFSPDLVLIVRGIGFAPDVLKEVGRKSTLFGWWIEREERVEEALREAALFDHYFFINSSCLKEGEGRGMGNMSLLHHSVDTTVFHPMEVPPKYDWCFVGGHSDLRRRFIEKALGVSTNGALYGPRWLKKGSGQGNMKNALKKVVEGEYIEGAALVRLYNESRVVLNITNWGRSKERTGMNMRVLEAPASGACLLTDGSADLEAVVTPDKHVVVYEGVDEFAEKLAYLLSHVPERERIAKEGRAHVAAHYTYDHVAGIIMERYDSMKKRGI